MAVVDGVLTYLNAQPDISTYLAANKVTPMRTIQGRSLPAITVQTVAYRFVHHLAASSEIGEATVQVDIWDTSYSAARNGADRVRAEMDGYTASAGAMGSDDVRRVILENETDILESTADGSEVGTFRISQDYTIWHKQTVPTF